MLAVIGLEVSFASVKGIDAFDYHLYSNKPIALIKQDDLGLVDDANLLLERLLNTNHLAASDVELVLLNAPSNDVINRIEVGFANTANALSLNYALLTAYQRSENNKRAIVILSLNQLQRDGVAAVLVCAKSLLTDIRMTEPLVTKVEERAQFLQQLSLCHVYAEINAHSSFVNGNKSNVISDHIQGFIADNQLQPEQIESLLTTSSLTAQTNKEHQYQCLLAFESLNASSYRVGCKIGNKVDDNVNHDVANGVTNDATNAISLETLKPSLLTNKPTLLTSVDCIENTSGHFSAMISLASSILCLDQYYRLGSKQSLIEEGNSLIKARWEASGFYCLADSTSYLFSKAQLSKAQLSKVLLSKTPLSKNQLSKSVLAEKSTKRYMAASHIEDSSHQLILLSKDHDVIKQSTDSEGALSKQNAINNGFLAQQTTKPVIFSAQSVEQLIDTLNEALLSDDLLCEDLLYEKMNEGLSSKPYGELENLALFKQFAARQYAEHLYQHQSSVETSDAESGTDEHCYCVVLLACSFSTLKKQLQLALSGIPSSLDSNTPWNKPWKTPAGSYFSAKPIRRTANKQRQPLSFVYPGVGALYVNMGKDLLRLFPEAYQALLNISDDLAFSLQDQLITPRLLSKPDYSQSVELEKSLRSELANIAEAGVSYACLLTTIWQQQLQIKATCAAGYSMGEVSMFAALDCWKTPQKMSQRLRESRIFTEQLSGTLKRLESAWGVSSSISSTVATRTATSTTSTTDSDDGVCHVNESATKNKPLWESYHLKATVEQVESLITFFPRVYITIVNTDESLVIAGDPEQCIKLAEQLKVRAIALNVPNIIHCDLAKSEYENMQTLYSLPVKHKISTQLYSSSCYLPVPLTEKAIAVSISKCLTEPVDFPRLINSMAKAGETVFIEMGPGKSLSTWIERILKNQQQVKPVTCLSVNQKNLDDYSAILKTIAPLISLGYPVNCQSFFSGSLIRPVKKLTASVLVS
ncbi:hypothetical protein V6255_01470 [Psychromonas arctica]|uniref:Malonyl-CoA:ACP transacylase (MAT) domain-containing protein n=1 Tax=Psychromonas arctica TaxID=168275 RepID=A0ABU9H7E0_9GAMM